MINPAKIIRGFPESREKELRTIKRFSMFEVFFYRSSLWHHELRVFFITQELSKLMKDVPEYDSQKASILALVHDDAEIVTGDIQLGHKQLMNPAQLQKIDENEANAIETLSQRFPKTIGGYIYKKLLYHALRKDCVEAHLVSYADKLDAYGESLHEVFGGNISALRAVINYTKILSGFEKKYHSLKPLFAHKESPFINLDMHTDSQKIHWGNYQYLNKPHKPENIGIKTELVFYNMWKNLILNRLGKEGIEILTTQTKAI